MGKTKLTVLAAAALMLSSAVAAYSHHSFAATYQVDKKITIEGKVKQLIMRNPHSFIHVDVTDETGKPVTWTIEGGGANQMRGDGKTEPLKIGDTITVECNPGRSLTGHRGRLVTVTRPSDGWTWGTRTGEVVD